MKIFVSLASKENEIPADKKKVEREFNIKQKQQRFYNIEEDNVERASEDSDLDDEECSNSHSYRR